MSIVRTLSFLLVASVLSAHAFQPANLSPRHQVGSTTTSTALPMGWLDNLLNPKTFPQDAKVTAKHILCKKFKEAKEVKDKCNKGNFGKLAKQFSTCPSGARGGSLGSFSPGQMAPDFDEAVFDPAVSKVGEVVGPIMTPFGYHLIIVEKRTGV